eukprot:66858-Alexandrium_andersonii.AAC.1
MAYARTNGNCRRKIRSPERLRKPPWTGVIVTSAAPPASARQRRPPRAKSTPTARTSPVSPRSTRVTMPRAPLTRPSEMS